MEILKLKAQIRSGTGKSHTRKIRAANWIPAVYYGHNQKTENIEIESAAFGAVVRARKTSHLFDLGLPNREESVAVIKEIQKDVVKDNVYYHIDFQHVSMSEKITVSCPVEIIGIPAGVKEDGGVLGHPVRTLDIECLPMDIPEKITVDVSNLRIGQSIHVRDIVVEKVTIKSSPDEVIALVTRIKEEVVVAPVVAEGEAVAAPAAGEAAAVVGEAKVGEEGKKEEKKDEKKKDDKKKDKKDK